MEIKKKAPGKAFRKGLSLVELFDKFPDDATAGQWFTENRWPHGVHCPGCGSDNVQVRKTRKPQPYRCRDCRKDFSAKTDTLMHSSNLGYRVWVIAMYLVATSIKGVSSMKLHRDLKISQPSAWHLAHRIRENFADGKARLPGFTGPVEVDETFIGGKEKNKHSHKKLHAGRGGIGKTPVVGAKDRETNRVSATVIGGTTQDDLEGFIQDRVKPGSTVYTDDHGGYSRIGLDFDHASVRHSVREYVKGARPTPTALSRSGRS